jgi:hypothetical protein
MKEEERESLVGVNLDAPVMEVQHKDLNRVGDSSCKSACPVCKVGVLLCRRDWRTLNLLSTDSCILCGQRFKYTDIEEEE